MASPSSLSSGSYGIVGVTTAGSPFSGITGSASANGAAAFAGGTTNPNAYAAYFSGRVVVDGSFTVINPANKHGAVKHPDGSYRLLYALESPESWLEDFGTGHLRGGTAAIPLDADFAAVVQTGAYHVFLTEDSETNGLYVSGKTATGFTVQEGGQGMSSGTFSYRVVARPKTDAKVQRWAPFTLPQVTIPTVHDLPQPSVPPAPSPPPEVRDPPRTANGAPGPAPLPSPGSGTTQDTPLSPALPAPPPRSG